MSDAMSRTQRFEALEEEVMELRRKSIDGQTVARAYDDLAETIAELPTKGELWDLARADMARCAIERAERVREISVAQANKADALAARGID